MYFPTYYSKSLHIAGILLISFTLSCKRKDLLFEQIHPSHSGISFNNRIPENDSINQLDIDNVYNGGGVGIGDFNKDGLPDLYFTGNYVECHLYINHGDFKFQNVTREANVGGEGRCCRGVSVVDINNDGWQDIYVCATLSNIPAKRKNLLYVNQGLNKHGIPEFKEMAVEYGLADSSHSTQAAFFDYDNDGDIDVYIVVNEILENVSPFLFRTLSKDGSFPSTGRLFRNDWNESLNHPVYSDVSKQAGIRTEGYGNAASIVDINNDGWKDIYVSNDYLTNDLLWINNRNGSFSEQLSAYFKHTSASAMGNDVGDINNDGLMDFITLDMNPEDNYRKKMMLNPNSYQVYQNTERYGYSYQYVRNTLQLNRGPGVGEQGSIGNPVFSEIAYFAGVAATDWSWCPLLTDFDNDGYRDIYITNGFPRDITDHDFGMFRNNAYQTASKKEILIQVPEVKLHNYVYRNNGDLSFTDVSDLWGMTLPTFSNGAAYADFDNDGDEDFVVNNINGDASLYKNNAREKNREGSHYLKLQLTGDKHNIQGLGACVEIFYDNGRQVWENSPYRGYLSTMEDIAIFGLGKTGIVDSVIIRWQSGKMQVLRNIPADRLLKVNIADAGNPYAWKKEQVETKAQFREVTGSVGIRFIHPENDFVDFNIQKLLPHKFSEYGPSLAAGDIDGNGLDDMIVGGSSSYSATLFLQQESGKFIQKSLLTDENLSAKTWDDMGILLFDAEGDGDPDLYISSGGFENEGNTVAYRDHFYLNDGKGNFSENHDAFPANYTSKSCVRAADIDKDGDLDLFAAGRVDPWNYPRPVSCFIYRNDTKNGHLQFTDVTKAVAGDLLNIGLVCDALFTDINNDGWTDLMLAGEWMPVTTLVNDKGIYKNATAHSGIGGHLGWWNSIAGGDFDNDGDTDYILGNLGLNTFYKASEQYPASIVAFDFDNNGSYDAFPAVYLASSQEDTIKREFPVHGRDDIIKQMISMRSKFQNYKSYATSTIEKLFSQEQLESALVLRANDFKSSYCRNDGNNKFTLVALPAEAQFSMLNGMTADDFNGDGNLDVLINGNDWGTEVSVGRYDALNGLLLMGNGRGDFVPRSMLESGFFIPGNGKAMVKLRSGNGEYLIAASQNRGPLKTYALNMNVGFLPVLTDEIYATLHFTNGKIRKQEFYYGCSFLSQSSRFLNTYNLVESVTFVNDKGEQRKVVL